MKTKLFFSLLWFSTLAAADTALPPGQDAAVNASIHFFADLRAGMTGLLNNSTSHMMVVGGVLWFILAAKNLFYTIGRLAGETVSGHHHSHLLQGLFLWFLRCSLAFMMLVGYFAPVYGGISFSQVIPGIAHYLSSTIQLDAVKSVLVQMNAVLHMATPNPFNFLMVYVYAELMGIMAAAELAMTAITSTSFLFMGALIFTGPLWIPFFIDFDPRWNTIFWSWIGDQIVYSMYQVFSDVFVAVFAGMYLNFFCRIMGNCTSATPSYAVGQFLGESVYLLLVTATFVFVMFQIPSFTSRRFSGFGALGQDFANSLQRAALALAFG